MNKLLVVALAFLALVAAEENNFKDYQVLRMTPTNDEQLEILYKFQNSTDHEFSFWRDPTHVNISVDLMVGPNKIKEFDSMVRLSGINYERIIQDVQTLIDAENPNERHDSLLKGQLQWDRYHSLDEIYDYLDLMAKTYPHVEVVTGGKSYQGRPIKGVKISFKEDNPGIFIEGGIHAREWISPATVTYIMNELLTSDVKEIKQLAESNNWYIFPLFNPDGYVFSQSKPENRLWRKNMKPAPFSDENVERGVDLNRNWGYHWTGKICNKPNAADDYAGVDAFSEIETQSLSEYIGSISKNLFAYMAFHSYSQALIIPYGYTDKHLDNYDQLYKIGTIAKDALAKRYKTKYVVTTPFDLFKSLCAGNSVDWVKGTFKTPITYTWELRDTGKYGFVLPASQIKNTGEEIVDALIALFKAAAELGIPKRK